MEINKQLFEDVLSGKLKGTFVFRNQLTCNSDELTRNTIDKYKSTYPYSIKSFTYTPSGIYHLCGDSNVDIVDFRPETNTETKELKIEAPEGFEIDKENSSFEKIVFKKKEDTKPRSWDEYYKRQRNHHAIGYFLDDDCCNIREFHCEYCDNPSLCRNVLPSKELAEAFLAMMQLMSLRQAWIGDWKPDWRKTISCIVIEDNTLLTATEYTSAQHVLSFPTQEMATDFMNTFKDLLEVARPLI